MDNAWQVFEMRKREREKGEHVESNCDTDILFEYNLRMYGKVSSTEDRILFDPIHTFSIRFNPADCDKECTHSSTSIDESERMKQHTFEHES